MESLGAWTAKDLPCADEGDPLALSPAQMRTIGYRTIDLLIERLSDPDMEAMRRGRPHELAELIGADVPERPRPWTQLMDQLDDGVLTFMSRLAHPSYFAFIPASSTFPGALGDLITSALDIDAGSWSSAAGPSHLELVVLDWFKQWIGYPQDAGGVLVSGGSAANVTALACAREALVGAGSDRAVIYASDQTHSSVSRAARLLGFGSDQIRRLPSDERYRLRTDALIEAIEADVAAGNQPLIVAANAGTTNTGAIDPLPELAAICRERGMWLHVDAAYGGFAALTGRGRRLLRGLELADSVTLDPHKWLYQPIECGCVLVREAGLLERAFAVAPDYLEDYRGGEVDFCDRGMQLTRSARALKVWLSLSYFGAAAFREAIDRALDLARLAERLIDEYPTLELLCPATLGVVCFRRRLGSLDDEEQLEHLNAELVTRFETSGRGLVSSTRLHGRYAIRMCVMNHTTSRVNVEETLGWLASQPVAVEGGLTEMLGRDDALPDRRDALPERRDALPERRGEAQAVAGAF
jgi:aromatic-L-amino-acid/L-tryptophan decarboxylase